MNAAPSDRADDPPPRTVAANADELISPTSVKLDADKLVPRGSLEIEDAKDRAVRRWGGIAILIAALVLSGGAIMVSGDDSKAADKAWSLLFIIVGYAGAYIFRNTGRSE